MMLHPCTIRHSQKWQLIIHMILQVVFIQNFNYISMQSSYFIWVPLFFHNTLRDKSNVHLSIFKITIEIFDCLSLAICTGVCQNGGQCVSPNMCQCEEGWRGSRCRTGKHDLFSNDIRMSSSCILHV